MMGDPAVLLVPQKDLDLAKSRLTLRPSRRRQIAVAMLRRALVAARGAQFAGVMVVLDNPADKAVFADLDVIAFHPGLRGLNPALEAGEEAARTLWGPVPIAVMPADLPLVTPKLLDRALRAAMPYERAFIPDSSARGTTLLFAGPGIALRPAYGPGSAAAHLAQGAYRIDDAELALLRHDVDDVTDLAAASLHFGERQRWEETA